VPDFVSDTLIYWSKDRTRLVDAKDKDADPGALFCGPGGYVPEDQARDLGLVAEKTLTVFGREHGHIAGAAVPERRDDERAHHPIVPPPAT
jgi:hypothetical protein